MLPWMSMRSDSVSKPCESSQPWTWTLSVAGAPPQLSPNCGGPNRPLPSAQEIQIHSDRFALLLCSGTCVTLPPDAKPEPDLRKGWPQGQG